MQYKVISPVEYCPVDNLGNAFTEYWQAWDIGSIIDTDTVNVPNGCKPLNVEWLLKKKAIEEV